MSSSSGSQANKHPKGKSVSPLKGSKKKIFKKQPSVKGVKSNFHSGRHGKRFVARFSDETYLGKDNNTVKNESQAQPFKSKGTAKAKGRDYLNSN